MTKLGQQIFAVVVIVINIMTQKAAWLCVIVNGKKNNGGLFSADEFPILYLA